VERIVLSLGIALFIVAAYGDVKTFRIPNLLVAAVTLLAVARLIVVGDPSAAVYTVGASVIVLAIGFVLFWQGFVGGGDAKLITAAALLVGYHNLYSFLVLMCLCGLLVTLAVLATRYLNRSPEPQPKLRLVAIPYGVAIAAGGIVTLLFQPSLLG
jgi:prepilin peptidase CpaA